MFVCEDCHEKTRGEFCTFRGSYGPCEVCGHQGLCADCHCEPKRRAAKTPVAWFGSPLSRMTTESKRKK